jgi:hypothetical protein
MSEGRVRDTDDQWSKVGFDDASTRFKSSAFDLDEEIIKVIDLLAC